MNRPNAARTFALEVVQRLQAAGFEALFAGGCVRDQLMGNPPKDFDVATNATPPQIRELFGKGRTLTIGESFGVICVLGPKSAGQIDVATFRQDEVYSDGRHPDSVQFTTAENDAQRRDFTINGLFYDPLADRVLDYVGGERDLGAKTIRAIGNASARIAEDRLRMLRAVRFAARFEFQIESETLAAIRQSAEGITLVSSERIANELRLMLGHKHRHLAFEGLRQTGLLSHLLPERTNGAPGDESRLRLIAQALQQLNSHRFEAALAVILYDVPDRSQFIDDIAQRWRLSNEESAAVGWILKHADSALEADLQPWPAIQRLLVQPWMAETLAVAVAVAATWKKRTEGIEFCQQRLSWPSERLNPKPLIDGNDLRLLNIAPGPIIREILNAVRDRQLSGEVSDKEQALAFARTMVP